MKPGTIEIVSASAGSGKTTFLASLLRNEVMRTGPDRVRPDAILATTFTRKAAAELKERVRTALLREGRVADAQRLAASRIGTVNAVCGALVGDFAFELGLSPSLSVLDEDRAGAEFARCLAEAVEAEEEQDLERLALRLGLGDAPGPRKGGMTWRKAVAQISDKARSNGVAPGDLPAMAERSIRGLFALLGTPDGTPGPELDRRLVAALDAAERALGQALTRDEAAGKRLQKNTQGAHQLIRDARSTLDRGELPWSVWHKLTLLNPGKRFLDLVAPLAAAAAAHDRHPRLREDLDRMIRSVYATAERALVAWQGRKAELGVLDFTDQEALALQLLTSPEHGEAARRELSAQLDLVLVDEFQDTSPIQLAVFLQLAALARRSVWVGDQKQAIYGFRGADPALMDAALGQLTGGAAVATLDRSWRSRPALVELTSELFAAAFPAQGIPAERVRLTPGRTQGSEGLGPVVARWTWSAKNVDQDCAALAATVAELLEDPDARVFDKDQGVERAIRAGDLAVLCRTRALADKLAGELANLGIPAVLPRDGLLSTPEGAVALAALRLAVDPRDSLAAATIARFLEGVGDPDGWLDRILKAPYAADFEHQPTLVALRAVAAELPTGGPLAVLDAALEAADLDGLCARWGSSRRRRANLERLRAHAVAWTEGCAAAGLACTAAGLVAHLDSLAGDGDLQAAQADEGSVTLSTWHAAKGLEWPVVVLFGLWKSYAGSALEVAAVPAPGALDLSDPLRDRWIRWWFSPYSSVKDLPFTQRLEDDPAQVEAARRQAQQELRVLYVGWTRARDRVVIADRPNRWGKGLLAHLRDASGPLLSEPAPGTAWAGVPVDVLVREVEAREPVEPPATPGQRPPRAGPRDHPPATRSPSKLAGEGRTRGEPEGLGPRIVLSGDPDMRRLGEAIHGFLAADRTGLRDREGVALRLLERWGVAGAVEAAAVVEAGDGLRRWAEARWPGASWHREWPMLHRLDDGSLVRGSLDLALRAEGGWIVVDHKSFPGGRRQAMERAREHAGQLRAYADAVEAATGEPVLETWIHLPVSGLAVRLEGSGPTT